MSAAYLSMTILSFFFLKAYIILRKFDITCLPGTYLDSTTPTDGDKLKIAGYINFDSL